MARPFTRTRTGRIAAALSDVEADAIARVAEDLGGAVEQPDDGMYRLFPTAYPDDAEKQESFASLTRDDLVAAKAAAARTTAASIAAGSRARGRWSAELDEETAGAWLSVLNDARLILGTRLGVTEDTDHRPLPEGDVRAPAHNMYLYLSALEEYLIEALHEGLEG